MGSVLGATNPYFDRRGIQAKSYRITPNYVMIFGKDERKIKLKSNVFKDDGNPKGCVRFQA